MKRIIQIGLNLSLAVILVALTLIPNIQPASSYPDSGIDAVPDKLVSDEVGTIECTGHSSSGTGTASHKLSLDGVSTIEGTVHLQSRTDHSGVDVCAYISCPCSGSHATTNAEGYFSIDLPPETYSITASMPGYLDAEATDVEVVAGETTTLSDIILTGGDANNDDVIDTTDLDEIAANFNLTEPSSADINDDGVVDIYDLVKAGIHFGEKGPIYWHHLPPSYTTEDIGVSSDITLADPSEIASYLLPCADIGNAVVIEVNVADNTPENPNDDAYSDITINVGELDVETCKVYKAGYGFLAEVPDVNHTSDSKGQ